MTEIEESDAARLAELDAGAWNALHRIGRALHSADASLQSTLDAVLTTAVSMVPNTDAASLSLLVRGRLAPQAMLGEAPRALEDEQLRCGEGPCYEASRGQTVVRITDADREDRWPSYATLAMSLGVRSVLCLPIWIDDQQLGSLSLYSPLLDAYRSYDIEVASLLATHAAVAIADARRTENLRRAITNRDIIGQAKGILMERYRLTPEQAFERLAATSQSLNRKLADVAEILATTGELPV